MVWFEWTAAIITAISIYLQTRENVWNWPTAIVSVVMYIVVYLRSGLYSDAGLQVYFLATSIYGWYHWLRGGVGDTVLPVTRVNRRTWAWSIALGIVFWFADASITSRIDGVAFPYIDAATTTVSLIAQWMIARKLLENWLLWIGVNVVYIPVLIIKGLYPTAGLYAVLLLLALKGYVDWRKSWLATQAKVGGVPAPAMA